MTAQQLKNSILQMAVQGKLVPQNPNDEPASVLLERIRAEKQQLVKEGKIKKSKNESVIYRVQKDGDAASDNLPYAVLEYDLPAGWELCRLNDLYNFIDYRGATPDKISSGVPFVTAKNVKVGYTDYSISEYISLDSYEKRKSRGISQKGDILFTTEAPLGNVALADLAEFSAGQRLITLQNYSANVPLNNMLFMNFLLSDFFKQQLKEKQTGTTVKGIKAEKLKELVLPVPPLAEQHRIVERIEELLPHIAAYDTADKKLTTLNATFPDTLKKSILQAAVQGKLVPQDPNDEPASVLLERIRAEKEALIRAGKIKRDKYESVISRRDNSHYTIRDGVEICIDEELPFEIPDSWEWTRLGAIGMTNIGLTYSPSDVTKGKGIAVLRSNNIKSGKICYDNLIYVDVDVSEKLMVQQGDILICARNGSRNLVGKSAIIEKDGMSFGAFMAIYRSECNPYIQLFVNSPLFRGQLDGANTTTINQVTQEMLKQALCPLPPMAEQYRIVNKYFELLQRIEQQLT